MQSKTGEDIKTVRIRTCFGESIGRIPWKNLSHASKLEKLRWSVRSLCVVLIALSLVILHYFAHLEWRVESLDNDLRLIRTQISSV